MREIENLLSKQKSEIEELKAPDEMEKRLRNALDTKTTHKSSNRLIKIACLFLIIIFAGYNFDALAYYSKKIIGYDEIMSDSLKNINEIGKGQIIGKSYTMKNGTTVTLDAIMADDNQMLVFYTTKNPNGDIDKKDINSFMDIKGLIRSYSSHGGSGKANDENTEIKWIMSFDAPHFFERTLIWQFSINDNGKLEQGSIKFNLDRNKAMGHSIKMKLNKNIKVDNREIKLDLITASATTTVIKGATQNTLELSKDYFNGERIRPDNLELKLIANGKEIEKQGSSMSTNLNGIKFTQSFEPLPQDLKTLEIKLVRFGADYDAKKNIKLDKKTQSFEVLGQKIEIKDIYEKNLDTYITIATEESVVLSKVYLIADDKKIQLSETIQDKEEKSTDGIITHTRTLHFKGTGNNLELNVDRIRYSKEYGEIINIPIR